MAESARFISQEGQVHQGVSRRVLVPAPNAGADWSVAVPGGVYWRVLTVAARLTTSAAVSNRKPRLVISDGNTTYAGFEAINSAAAGLAFGYTWVAGFLGGSAGTDQLFPVIGFSLLSLETGSTIGVATRGLDAADQWSSVILGIEEFYLTAVALSERAQDHERARDEVLAVLASEGPQIALPALPG